MENRTCKLQVLLCEIWAIIWTSTYYSSVDMCLRHCSFENFLSFNYSTFTIFIATLHDDMAVKSCKQRFQESELSEEM